MSCVSVPGWEAEGAAWLELGGAGVGIIAGGTMAGVGRCRLWRNAGGWRSTGGWRKTFSPMVEDTIIARQNRHYNTYNT